MLQPQTSVIQTFCETKFDDNLLLEILLFVQNGRTMTQTLSEVAIDLKRKDIT